MKSFILGLSALGFAISAPAFASSELVTNGGFENTTNGAGQTGHNTDAVGWTSNGYNFIFASGTADSTGSNGVYGNLQLWGPNNGSANGLGDSPTGGNFIGADGAFGQAPVWQTISGLTVGRQYTVSFDWAGAQQLHYDGPTTERWLVTLGNEALCPSCIGDYNNPTFNPAITQSTSVWNNPNHGFSGWQHESMTFTAGGTTQVLSFLAVGTPGGLPPFSLLDGVSMKAAVPEPATWAMMITGFGLVGGAIRRRRSNDVLSAA